MLSKQSSNRKSFLGSVVGARLKLSVVQCSTRSKSVSWFDINFVTLRGEIAKNLLIFFASGL